MDSSEKKELKTVVGESLKELVLPKLEKIENHQKEHDEKFEKIIKKQDAIFDAVGDAKVDITVIQEDISDLKYTDERIETHLNSVLSNQDDMLVKTSQLNRRVLRLESKKG